MGTRRKRMRSENQQQEPNQAAIKKIENMKMEISADDSPSDPANPPPTSSDSPTDLAVLSSQNWAELPESLLFLILDRIFSATDLLAFSATCLPWRSVAVSAPCCGPPLFLAPAVVHPDRLPPSWVGPPSCRLHTATAANRSYHSPVSPRTLIRSCIGCCHAHLIFVSGNCVVLANVFTGREVQSPDFPPGSFHLNIGVLTAPLASTSCLVLAAALNIKTNDFSILCWRLGGGEWSELKLTNSPKIRSLVVFKGQVFGLDSLYRLIVVELGPQMSWRLLEAELSTGRFLFHYYGKLGEHLVECNRELLLVLFVPTGKLWAPGPPKIEVYRLDMARSVWVKKESLGDWCLFIDAVGSCPFACPNPTRWGGRRNCVYIAGPGYEWWSVLPLDGEAVDATDESPLNSRYVPLPSWPSPVWVYPSMAL